MSQNDQHTDAPEDGAPEQSGDAPDTSGGRRVLRRVLLGLGGLVALVVVLVVALLLVLQTNWGASKVGDFLTEVANPYEAADLSIGDIDGNWISHLELLDVALTRTDSASGERVRMAQLDSLELRYDLLSLFQKKLRVREVGVSGLSVAMRQQADSTWDLLQPFGGAEDTSQSAFTVQVDDITVEDTRFAAQFYAPGRDSTLRVSNLSAQVDTLLLSPEETRVDLRSLQAWFTPPGDSLTRTFQASLALADGRLDVRQFGLDSPYSDVTAEGTLLLPNGGDGAPVEDADFTLTAQPLDFRDLAGFVPALDPSKSLTLEARVTGSSRLLTVDAGAQLSDGATVTLDGQLTPDAAGPLRYDLQGQIRSLNPAFFTADTSAGVLNADFAADLEGPQLDQIGGTAEARLFDTRVGEYQIGETNLEAAFTDGRAVFDLTSSLRGARFAAEGTARPFDAAPTYDARLRFDALDVGRLASAPAQQSNLAGTLRINGTGTDPAAADLTARLDLDPSTLNRYALDASRLEARLADGDVRFEADLNSPQGGLAAQGRAQGLTTDAPRFAVTEGVLDGVDVAALSGDTTRSRLRGTFSLRGQGSSTENLRIDDAALALRDSYYGPYQITEADLTAALADQRLRAQLRAALGDAGTFALNATARPFDDVLSYSVSDGSFENVNIGALAQDSTQRSDLDGTFALDGRGTDPQALSLTAELGLTGDSLNQQAIESAQLSAALDGGALTYDAQLTVPEGRTQLAGTARPFDETPRFALTEGALRGLNLGALAGIDGLQTNLNADLQASAEGTDPRTATLGAQIDFAESRINDAQITGGAVQVQAENGQASVDGTVNLDQGRLTLGGQADFSGDAPRYEAEGTAEALDLAALAGIDTLEAGASLRFAVQGQGTDPAAMTLTAQAQLTDARVGPVTADSSSLDVRLANGLLRVDSLRLRSNVLTARGGGQIALFDTAAAYPSDFRLAATVESLTPLESLIGAQTLALSGGEATLRVEGPPGRVGFEAAANLRSLVYNDIRLAGFETTATGQISDSLSLASADVRGSLAYLTLPSIDAENTDFELNYTDDQQLAFLTDLTLDEDRQSRFTGVLDLRPDNQRLQLDTLNVRLGEARWELLQEASITYGEAYRVSGFLISSETQQIAMDGVVDLDGEQNLVLTIEGFRLGAVADLGGFDGLDGTLNGSLDLTGPAEAPQIDGALAFNIRSYGDPVGDLSLALGYADQRFTLDALLTHRDGSTLSAEGGVPVDLRLNTASDSAGAAPDLLAQQDLDLSVTADAFSIGWIRPFLDPATIDRIGGQLTGDLQITGTPDAPELTGEAALEGAALGLADLGVTYRDLEADLQFTEDQVVLRSAQMTSDGGRLTAEGTINLTNLTLGQYALDIRARDFLAISSPEIRTVTDADLQLRGTTEQPELTGDLNLVSADIYIGGDDEAANPDLAEVALSEGDLTTLRERFGVRVSEADTTTVTAYEALAMTLDIEMQRDVWLRSRSNPELNVQFIGDLDVQKEHFEDLQVFGTIEVLPERSYVEQFGKRFTITNGTLSFNGAVADPVLDLEAAYGVPAQGTAGQDQITITLGVEGRPDDLNLTLGSEPPASQADIVSYIATGRPADQAFQGGSGGEGGGEGLGGAATGLAIGQAAALVENLVGSELGLDVVEIEPDGLNGATLTAGRYLSPRLYVAVRQPFSRGSASASTTGQDAPQTQVTLEYELANWLLGRLTGGAGTLQANLQFRYAY